MPFIALALFSFFVWVASPLSAAKAKAPLATAASGSYAKAGDSFVVADAFAYEGKGFFGDETVVKVRLTGTLLDRKALDQALDVAGELDRQTAEDTGTVTLDIALDASWEGASYRLPGGAACGFCSSSAQAAQARLRIEDGRVKGKLKTKAADEPDGDGLDIDLTLDVPIAKPTGVTALPQDGGEPGRWLLTCRAAIDALNREAIVSSCSEEIAARLDSFVDQEREERAASFRNDLLYLYPSLALPAIAITGGRTKGDQAELTVDGTQGNDRYRGSLFLRRVEGAWRIARDKVEQNWD